MSAQVHELPAETDRQAEFDALCAAVWASPRQRAEALRIAGPADFAVGRHSTLWEAMGSLNAAGEFDPGLLTEHLEKSGRFDAVGGSAFIGDVLDANQATGAFAVEYARRVADRARRRRAHVAAQRLAQELAEPGCDVAEVVHGGADQLLGTVRGDADGIITVGMLSDEVWDLREHGVDQGVTSGWKSLDRLYRPELGQVTVVTGVPSHGKSSWLDDLLRRLAERHGWKALMFSPERKRSKHLARLVSLRSGRAFADLDDKDLVDALGWCDEHFRWLDPGDVPTIAAILSTARLAHDDNPAQALVIDPWNWVTSTRSRDEKLTEWIDRALAELARFAQRNRIHVWVVAHPTKMRQHEGGSLEGRYYVPRPYDISESAAWFNKPDWCLAVWRDHLAPGIGEPGYEPERDPAITEIHVQKTRDDDLGRIGVAALRFDSGTRRYYELDGRF